MSDMSSHPKANKTAVLYRMVTPEHVCPWGLKAKDLLQRSGYRVEDRHLKTRGETDAFKAQHHVPTTPQVYVNGNFLGVCDIWRETHANGELGWWVKEAAQA